MASLKLVLQKTIGFKTFFVMKAGCSLGFDVAVSRRSRDLFLNCLCLVSPCKFYWNVSVSDIKSNVSDMKVSFTVNFMLSFFHAPPFWSICDALFTSVWQRTRLRYLLSIPCPVFLFFRFSPSFLSSRFLFSCYCPFYKCVRTVPVTSS